MKRTVGDYKKDILIDENDLENEWIEQPSLYLYYAEAHSKAMHIKDSIKDRLDQVSAKLDSDIRKNWEKYFNSKPTEIAIKNYIILHPEIRKWEKKYLDALRDANTLAGVKNSFEHRKQALGNIVSLRISGFHSEPRNKVRDLKNKGGHEERKQELNRNKSLKSRVTSRKKKRKVRRNE